MPQDIDLLQGSWSIKSLTLEGQEMPAAMFANASTVVQGNRFTSLGMGTQYEGTLELDASTNPRQLNMNFDAGPEKGNVNLGIYEISGDIWKLSIATRGSVRPSTFISASGTGIALEILQRVKPSAQ
jgi:uncharacterized protein (TIGR03067 family)